MKLQLLLLLFIITGSVSAQVNKKLVKERSKQVHVTVPPMGIWLHDNVFIDETEIANIHWLEFECYLKKDSSESYQQRMTPYTDDIDWKPRDTSRYLLVKYERIDTISGPDVYRDHYLRYPGFRYFPVVGVTYEQAIAYCEWRSDIVTNNFNQKLAEKKSKKRVYVHYRLPTEEEWKLAALGYDSTVNQQTGLKNISIPYNKEAAKNYKVAGVNTEGYRRPDYNCYYVRPFSTGIRVLDEDQGTHFIYDYSPNAIGLYNMIGNVSEMIDQEGIAKGGHWNLPADSCLISERQYYDCPNAWTGFRCVAEVYEYDIDSTVHYMAPLMAKESNCSMVIERSKSNEYELNQTNPEYIRNKTLLTGRQYEVNTKGKLFLNGKETSVDEVIYLNDSSNSVLEWEVENTPTPDSAYISACYYRRGNVLHPYEKWKYVNKNIYPYAIREVYKNPEHQYMNIHGINIMVFYQENGVTKKESFFRVIEYRP